MASFCPPSLETLIDCFAALPGIGKKSAQRLAFHVLSLPEGGAEACDYWQWDSANSAVIIPNERGWTGWSAFVCRAEAAEILAQLVSSGEVRVSDIIAQLQKNVRILEQLQEAQKNDQSQTNMMNSPVMKWFFPIFSVWICATSNAAFSIYWMAANVIQIVQQLAVNWYFDRQDAKAAAAQATEEQSL